jgi:uncharacterized membrane protein
VGQRDPVHLPDGQVGAVAQDGAPDLAAALAFYLLQLTIIRVEGPSSRLKVAIGRDVKGKVSPVIYVIGIALAYVTPWLGVALYAVVAVMWLVPDRRMERFVVDHADAA